MAEAQWYVAHTYSGYENKVKTNNEKAIENRHLEEQILEVRIPMIDVMEMKNGASTIKMVIASISKITMDMNHGVNMNMIKMTI